MKTIFILTLIALFILFLGFCRISLYVKINSEEGTVICIGFLFFKFTLAPKTKKAKKQKNKTKVKNQSETNTGNEKNKKEDSDKKILDTMCGVKENWGLLLNIISNLKRGIVVDRLEITWSIAKEDAASSAIFYGRVAAVFYPLLSLIDRNFNIKIKEINIHPDFFHDKSFFYFNFRVRIRVYKLLYIAFELLKFFLKLQLKQKR